MLFASTCYQYNDGTTYHLSADRQQGSELLKYGVQWRGQRSIVFVVTLCEMSTRYKKCSLPLCRVQEEDCEDVQTV